VAKVSDLEAALRPIVAKLVADELAKHRPANDGEHLTVAEYARRLSVSERTVRDAIRESRLEHQRIGRAVRIPAGARIGPRVDAATARARLVLLGGKR
jgi:excisionase family DNA binding protein